MSLSFAGSDYSVAAVMESPLSLPQSISTPGEFVTPAQLPLILRNAEMLNAINFAIDAARENGRLIASQTVWNAKRFLQLLSADVPATDAYVSEQESICFDWDEDCQCQLSVMVQHGGRIAFAAYFTGDRLNGAANFTGAELPTELVAAISRWQRGGKVR